MKRFNIISGVLVLVIGVLWIGKGFVERGRPAYKLAKKMQATCATGTVTIKSTAPQAEEIHFDGDNFNVTITRLDLFNVYGPMVQMLRGGNTKIAVTGADAAAKVSIIIKQPYIIFLADKGGASCVLKTIDLELPNSEVLHPKP